MQAICTNFPFGILTSPTYNVTITQITVEGTIVNLEFGAIFDSGTSFTYLNDPAYTQISESVSGLLNVLHSIIFVLQKLNQFDLAILQFNSLAKENRHSNGSDIPFEYCYDLRLVTAKDKASLYYSFFLVNVCVHTLSNHAFTWLYPQAKPNEL